MQLNSQVYYTFTKHYTHTYTTHIHKQDTAHTHIHTQTILYIATYVLYMYVHAPLAITQMCTHKICTNNLHTCMQTLYAHTYIIIHVHMHACIHIHTNKYTKTHTYTQDMHTCTHVHTYTHTHMYIHTPYIETICTDAYVIIRQ